DLSVGEAIEGMSQLVGKRILRDVGGGLEFINELVRAHVYGRVPSPARTVLHQAIGDRLLQEEETGQLVPGLELAWHLTRATNVEDATEHLLRGAREAMDSGAADRAVLALESALPSLAAPHAGQARLILAEAFFEICRWRDSLRVLSEAPAHLPPESLLLSEA